MKKLIYFLSFALVTVFSNAQDTKQKQEIPDVKALVEAQRFEFVAESANPMRGRSVFLSPGYTFFVSKDTIESYLPYFGRAYQAPMNPSDAGIRFTSTDFTYTIKDRKKKGWDIFIKTNDASPPTQANLSIFANGSASLRVTSIDRQSISFYGYIRKRSSK
jgi:hypothetical protein